MKKKEYLIPYMKSKLKFEYFCVGRIESSRSVIMKFVCLQSVPKGSRKEFDWNAIFEVCHLNRFTKQAFEVKFEQICFEF